MWRRVAPAYLAVLALAAASVVSVQARAMAIPDALEAPGQNVLLFETQATGVQVYVCKARTEDPNTFEWSFKAPIAELWNERGEMVGKHYAGPTWEGNDGSKVIGQVVERANAPDPEAIPWLLLRAKGNVGKGALSQVTYVQRLNTAGGVAPTEGCDRASVGTEREVGYTATYAFYYGGALQ
jgi:hypothetical protein